MSKTYAVDNVTEVPVTAETYCLRVVVQENYDSLTPPTSDLIQTVPAGTTPVRVAKGTPAIYTKGTTYYPGERVGTIKARTGSITVQQVEGGQV